MKRKEIREKVSKEVWRCYNNDFGTLEAEIPLTDDTCALLVKDFGELPVCHIYFDDDDEERNLPLLCELIEREALEALNDINEPMFDGYVDDVPDTFRRDYWQPLRFKGTRESWS